MYLEILSKKDLEDFRDQIIDEIIRASNNQAPKKWLRSKDVRNILSISPGTLQNMRIHGYIPYSKIGGTLFYDNDEINKILNDNKSLN